MLGNGEIYAVWRIIERRESCLIVARIRLRNRALVMEEHKPK
jgi:hypothetical protein